MGNLIIKGKGGAGNKLILQDQAGGAVLTTADSGATIANASLTTPTIASMTNCTFPAGHIIQTVIKHTTTKVTFSSGSYATSGLEQTITPKVANSTLLIQVHGKTECNNTSNNLGHDCKVTRASGTSASESATSVYAQSWTNYFNRDDFSSDYYPLLHILFTDTASHGQVTYNMWGRKYQGSSSNPNWSFADYNGPSGEPHRGYMIIQEIAA